MERLLIYIKHNFAFLWRLIESVNGIGFTILYRKLLEEMLISVFIENIKLPFVFRRLNIRDTSQLFEMINRQNSADLQYFHPHDFDEKSIRKQFNNRTLLMMGVFDDGNLAGYFFLRFFINRKCFVGRIIDKPYRGIGIGAVMNSIMYEIAWRMRFRCLSTISRHNAAVMRAHSKNPTMIVRKELQNDYLLVEFVREAPGAVQ